jgi:beta-N-acetylhexosaminidase
MPERTNPYCAALVARLSTDQKIGALMTLGFSGTMITPHVRAAIEKYHCSGFRCTPRIRRFGSYIDPHTKKKVVDIKDTTGYKTEAKLNAPLASLNEYRDILSELQTLAMARPGGVPLHFSLDQEGGASGELSMGTAVHFPSPMGMAATGDPELVYEANLARGRQMRSIGINWSHTPVLDINVEPANPEICTRSFSDRAEDVVTYARQLCLGLQDAGIIAAGKHFPGRGDSPMDAHFKIPTIDVPMDVLWERDLLPYRVLIEEGVLPTIMLAHSIYPAVDANDVSTVSKPLITGLLREKMGFDGVITTDSMTMAGIATRYGVPEACAMSLAAGADLVLMKADNDLVALTFEAIKRFVDEKKISERDLDDKVYRVLNMKYEYGLFHWANNWTESPDDITSDPQIRHIATTASRRSILVARDRAGLLPIAGNKKILFVQQILSQPNTIHNHSAMTFMRSLDFCPEAGYVEIGSVADDADRERLADKVGDYDIVVMTNLFNRGTTPNTEFVTECIQKYADTQFVVISNTPYPMTIPDEADTVIVAFGPTPQQREQLAEILFGAATAEGLWPLAFSLNS